MAASISYIYTAIYFLFSSCVIYPPTEVISAGLTIEALFSSFLGSEDILFVNYHIKRTSLTLVVHSLLPIGYCLGTELMFEESGIIYSVWTNNAAIYTVIFLILSLVIPAISSILVFFWYQRDWKNHPISVNLCKYGRPRWQAVAAHINIEYRRMDKFSSGHGNITRVIVTDSWLVKVSPYFLYVVQQSDAELSLLNSEQFELSHIDATGVQYVTISVSSTSKKISAFQIRLNSLEYGDLREKLQQPIDNAKNVVIHQTLGERFLEAFIAQVNANPRYSVADTQNLEQCIGCMQTTSNVKLDKLCRDDNASGNPKCMNCYCRPMWCIECMGKWYASRQDINHPEEWLSKSSPCPTCRSVFCMLDVHLIE